MTLTRKQKMAEFEQGYSVSVTGRHVHVTQSMKDYAVEKLSKIERFGNRIIDVDVIMDIQKLMHTVDIVMKYGHTVIRSHAATTDMYVSIDQAVDKLEAQLIKYKSRIQDYHAKALPVTEVPVTVYGAAPDDEVFEFNVEIEKQNKKQHALDIGHHKIIKRELMPLRILTDEEAIMKMDLSGAPVIAFRSEVDRKIKVIYRQEDDGNYAIIQLE